MDGAPYKNAKEGVGTLLSVFACMHTATQSPQICKIVGQTITYNRAASLVSSSLNDMQYSNAHERDINSVASIHGCIGYVLLRKANL